MDAVVASDGMRIDCRPHIQPAQTQPKRVRKTTLRTAESSSSATHAAASHGGAAAPLPALACLSGRVSDSAALETRAGEDALCGRSTWPRSDRELSHQSDHSPVRRFTSTSLLLCVCVSFAIRSVFRITTSVSSSGVSRFYGRKLSRRLDRSFLLRRCCRRRCCCAFAQRSFIRDCRKPVPPSRIRLTIALGSSWRPVTSHLDACRGGGTTPIPCRQIKCMACECRSVTVLKHMLCANLPA